MSPNTPNEPRAEKTFTASKATASAAGSFAPGAADPAAVPTRVGPYRIRRVIATGGMGTVYEATQENPRRVVAVKVMKHGIASRSAMRRFEYEAQLLARLHHSGIAQIYEAGTHDDGSGPVPYFAMEYIPAARSITAYAQEKKLDTRSRLELFVQVCEAVHHGHQKGIIHRDLKPGNILVDAHGEVKIIDFGVARGTDSDLAVTTLQTDVGQLIGTLQYMSPEQCAADPHDIDVRSDVYALGVVLYELLSGKLPYDVRGKPIYECTRTIREQEPSRLSTTIGWDGRRARHLRGDVETIASKALEKDRARRYQSAVELAQDLQRYLDGEAIVARPPSIVYQLRVFARRHKALVGGTAVAFVAVLAGAIVSTSLYIRAERARAQATRERDRAETINTFLADMLGTVDPWRAGPGGAGKAPTEASVRELLETAAARVPERFADQPEAEAEVRATLGRAFFTLGRFDEAEREWRRSLELFRRTLGDDDPRTRKAVRGLAHILLQQGKYDESTALTRAAYKRCRASLGLTHPETLSQAEVLGYALVRGGRFAEFDALARELEPALESCSDVPVDARSYWTAHRGSALTYLGRLHEAEVITRGGLERAERAGGAHNLATCFVALILTFNLREQGRYTEAEQLMRAATDEFRRQLGPEHPYVGCAVLNLMGILGDEGHLHEAQTALEQLLDTQLRDLGPAHPYTQETTLELLRILNRRGEFSQAESRARALVAALRPTLGEANYDTLEALEARSVALYGLARWEEAEQTAREVLQTAERAFASGYYHLPQFRCHWGRCLTEVGHFEEAETQLKLAYDGEMAMRGPEHRNTREVMACLVHLYERWGKSGEAGRWRSKLRETQPTSGPA